MCEPLAEMLIDIPPKSLVYKPLKAFSFKPFSFFYLKEDMLVLTADRPPSCGAVVTDVKNIYVAAADFIAVATQRMCFTVGL